MTRSTKASILAISLVSLLLLGGCGGDTKQQPAPAPAPVGAPPPPPPPGGEQKIGPSGATVFEDVPTLKGSVITQVTFERVRSTGGAMASQLTVGSAGTTVVSCYADVNGGENPVGAAAFDFASVPGAQLIADTTSPSGYAVGPVRSINTPAGTFTHLALISTMPGPGGSTIVTFSSAEAASTALTFPTLSPALLVSSLLQAANGAAESKLALSGTDATLTFALVGNGACPPPAPSP